VIERPDCIVIGAGMSGLAAADALSRQGLGVTILEASDAVGGLARSVIVEGEPVEPYYHHVFPQDGETRAALRELGMDATLQWRHASMAILHRGHVYPFDGPTDLLSFSALSLPSRVRFGAATVAQVLRRDSRRMDGTAVSRDAPRWFGKSGYATIWRPMLEAKFGPHAPDVAMAWLVARIRQRAGARKATGDRLGYIRGGTGALASTYARRIAIRGVRLLLSARVSSLRWLDGMWIATITSPDGNAEIAAPRVIACVSGPVLARLVDLPAPYAAAVAAIPFRGIVCVLVELTESLSRHYWVNVTDQLGLGCVGIIEHTNLVGSERYGGRRLVYLAHYVDRTDPGWTATADELVEPILPAFRSLNPRFREDWIVNATVARDPFAQPVPLAGGPMATLTMEPGLPGLVHASMAHVYPDDRGVSKALALGGRAAQLVAGVYVTERG
jgi:protoporphyrinogen oxidase